MKAWDVGGRHVAVVNVDEVAVPPCVTSAGQVYERLPGKTEPVTALRLAALFERGKARRAAAEAGAVDAATDYQRRPVIFPEPPYLCFTLALSPTGKVEDVGGRLFTQTFDETLREVFTGLPTEPLFPYPGHQDFETSISQDARSAVASGESNRPRWFVRAAWDGSVAVSLDLNPEAEHAARLLADALFDDAVRPAAQAASTLVTALGGYGECHAVLNVEAHTFTLGDGQGGYGQIGRVRPIQVWTDSEGRLSELVLARMKREVLRACRLDAYEPEP